MKSNTKLIIIGAVAGTINGLFGAGGGLFMVPLLMRYGDLDEKKTFATAVAAILPLALASYTVFCLRGGNVWLDAWPYALGGIIGGIISPHIFRKLSTVWIHRLFGALILYGGIKAVFFS